MTEKKLFNLIKVKDKIIETQENIGSIRIALIENEDVQVAYKGGHNIVSLDGWTIFKMTVVGLCNKVEKVFDELQSIAIANGKGMDIDGDLIDPETYEKLKVKADEIDELCTKILNEINLLIGDK